MSFLFFFFQAEDGIRDGHVAGVQTCALPILPGRSIVINRTCALSSKSSPKCMLFPVAAPAMNSTGSPVAGPNDLPANTRPALEETTHSGEVCMFLPYVLCMTSSHQLGFVLL